jgi:AsmA protein
MQALKILGIALSGLAGLMLLLLLAVWLFVNPNDYRGRIAQSVKEATDRDLSLPGKIKLGVFPWVALEFGPASLGNPPGFSAEPFASVQRVALRVKLLPLLRRRLLIGRIQIDGLDLRLLRNAYGRGNWQESGGETTTPGSHPSGASQPGTLADMDGVVIKDSRLSYQDVVADHVNLDVGHVISGIAVPVKLKLDLLTGREARPIGLASHFDVTLDIAKQLYRMAHITLDRAAIQFSALSDNPRRSGSSRRASACPEIRTASRSYPHSRSAAMPRAAGRTSDQRATPVRLRMQRPSIR